MRSLGIAAWCAWVVLSVSSCSLPAPVAEDVAEAPGSRMFTVAPGALDGTYLKVLWPYQHDKGIHGLYYDKGIATLTTVDNELVRLDMVTGLPRGRRLKLNQPLRFAPAVYRHRTGGDLNDEIFVVQEGDVLSCIEAESLLEVWSANLGYGVACAPCVGETMVYLCAEGGRINTLRKEARTEAWTFAASRSIVAPPVLDGNVVYAASEDGNLYTFNAMAGYVATGTGRSWVGTTRARIATSPVVYQHRVFVASLDHILYAFERSDGVLAWKFHVGRFVSEQPRAAANTIFAIGEERAGGLRTMYAVNSASGQSRWKRRVEGSGGGAYQENGVPGVEKFLAVGRELVYVLAQDADEIWGLRIDDGVLVHRVPLTERPDFVVEQDAQQGRDADAIGLILMGMKDGRILALIERKVYQPTPAAPPRA